MRWKPDKLTLWLYPEISLFESDDDRINVIRQYRKPRSWREGSLVFGILGISFVLHLFMKMVRPYGPLAYLVALVLVAIPLGLPIVAVYLATWHRPMQRYLREQLLARGIPVCLSCGYDLRGQMEARCPECGTPFDASLLEDKGEQP